MVYFIVILITFGCYLAFETKRNNSSKKTFFYIIEFVLLVLVAGLRYRVGGDSLSYEDDYATLDGLQEIRYYSFSTSQYGFLWYVFVAICQLISSDWVVLQVVHALIVNAAVFIFVKKHCHNPFLAIFLYTIFNYLYFSTEIIRASLAVSIFLLWGYDALLKKQWVKYFVIVVIAANFHIEGAAFALFPLAFVIGTARITEVRLIVFLIISIVLINVFRIDDMLYTLSAYSEAFDRRAGLYNVAVERTTNAIIVKFLSLVPIFICLWGTKFLNYDNHSLKLVRGLLILYALGSVLTFYFPSFFSRIIDGIRIIYVIAFADIIGALYEKRKTSLGALVLFLALFCGGYLQYREQETWFKYYPYHSVVNPVREPIREFWFTD